MHEKFMQAAIKEALKTKNEIPVGAVIVKDNQIIAKSHNLKEKNNDITAHAEIVALRKAAKKLNNWRLDECDLYVTLEPCPMCGWTILQSRIKNIYFGSYDLNYGTFSNTTLTNISQSKPNIYGGILEDQCNNILEKFFKKLRTPKI